MTLVDFTIHLEVSDQEPGVPQDEDSLKEWLVPDLLTSIKRVLGHPGDYGAWFDGLKANYTITIVD